MPFMEKTIAHLQKLYNTVDDIYTKGLIADAIEMLYAIERALLDNGR